MATALANRLEKKDMRAGPGHEKTPPPIVTGTLPQGNAAGDATGDNAAGSPLPAEDAAAPAAAPSHDHARATQRVTGSVSAGFWDRSPILLKNGYSVFAKGSLTV